MDPRRLGLRTGGPRSAHPRRPGLITSPGRTLRPPRPRHPGKAHPMPVELLATCWTHAGDAIPVTGRHLSPLDLRARAEAVAAAGFTGIGFTIDDLRAAEATYDLPQVRRICDDLGL